MIGQPSKGGILGVVSGQDYRDGRAALREQNAVLEEELAEREAELQRREHELAERNAELLAKDAELAELRARVPPPTPAGDGKRRCTACERVNDAHYKFCLGCGADLSSAPLASEQSDAVAAAHEPPQRWLAFALAVVALMAGVIAALAMRP